eukprot:TRINITY_DN6111_c0_g5_i1.p1 TRINITY_DN6111_c0_g5~~TRINITY_DN6111_c0_g5_i1.p1  ORF type:complete len:691 (-),score=89.31 TRINITY_DN6111_c0_g5_i1:404-2476(-)
MAADARGADVAPLDSSQEPHIPSSVDALPFTSPMPQFTREFSCVDSTMALEDAGFSIPGKPSCLLSTLTEMKEQLQALLDGQAQLRSLMSPQLGKGAVGFPVTNGFHVAPDVGPAKTVGFHKPPSEVDEALGQENFLVLQDVHIEPKSPRNKAKPKLVRSGSRESAESTSQWRRRRRRSCVDGAISPISAMSRPSRRSCVDGAITPTSVDGDSDCPVLEGAIPRTSVLSTLSGFGYTGVAHKRSRSAFDGLRTAAEDKKELRTVFLRAERLVDAELSVRPLAERVRSLTKTQVEMLIDSCIGAIILVNALFIGFSMDSGSEYRDVVLVIDVCFSALFILELITKLYVHGFREQFTGENRLMNAFDATLILLDLFQLFLQVMYASVLDGTAAANVADLPSASLFRVVRLCRLVRILRLLRHPILQTLLMMMHGMIGGLPTLGWALLLFVLSVYVVALLCREFLGRRPEDNMHQYFHNVPRAMVTTFRCSFGECETIEGMPIFEHVEKEYGMWFSILYCLFAFSMSIGMFNVISAIFVQSTMAAAIGMKHKQKKARLQDEDLWSTRVTTIVRRISTIILGLDLSDKLSEQVDLIYDLDVSCETMDKLGADPAVKAALEELDVDPEDHECLSDILDVDQNGSVVVIELLEGIRRLRGNPRRSDIVSLDLLCRSMQNMLSEVHTIVSTAFPNQS